MSLCAIGMPVSGPASVRASRSSARRAAESAWSSSKEMKAFSCVLSRPMRSRQARVSSTEESFFAASRPESSRSVEFSTLLEHLRHEVQPVLNRGGDRLIWVALIRLAHLVRPQSLTEVDGVGHRLDALRIDAAHLIDQAEDPVKAIEDRMGFFRLDLDASEPRKPANVVGGKRHFSLDQGAAGSTTVFPVASLAYHSDHSEGP